MYGGITRAMASTWATVGGVTSSSDVGGRVIRRHGLDAMTLSSTAAVRTRTIAPFRSRSVPELNALRDRLTAWLAPLRSTAEGLVPQMPVEDRAADTWDPLEIVADLAGGHWPSRSRAACLAMTRNEVVQDEQTRLKRQPTAARRPPRVRAGGPQGGSAQPGPARPLLQDAEAPWSEYGTKGLNAYHLANSWRA